MWIHRAYRMRLRPTGEQRALLERIAGCCRKVYNIFLQQRQDLYQAHIRGGQRAHPTVDLPPLHRVSVIDQMGQVSAMREQFPFLKVAPFHVLQQVAVDLEDAYQRFYAGQTKHPTWWRREDGASFRFPDPQQIRQSQDFLRLPKLGAVAWTLSRPITGTIRSVTVSCDGDHWYASVAVQVEIDDPTMPAGPAVAIDVGIRATATPSDGAPPFVAPVARRCERRRQRIRQRRIARRQRHSRHHHQAVRRYRRSQRRITRRVHHALHVFTTHLAKTHREIVLEDLRLTSMTASARGTVAEPGVRVRQKAGLNRSLQERALGEIRRQLAYKAAWYGSRAFVVPAPYSSQTCARCGHVAAGNRHGPSFRCLACGHAQDADRNAADVLLQRHIAGQGREITMPTVPRDTRKRVPRRKAGTDASGDTTPADNGGASAQEPAQACA